MVEGWKYYKQAAVPTTAPHRPPNLEPIKNGTIWKDLGGGGTPLLARYCSNWDCGYETNWWYVIKDTPFNIDLVKSKRRYEINKGKKNYTVKRINPDEYGQDILSVTKDAYRGWPEKYRPILEDKEFIASLSLWNDAYVYGAFCKEDNSLCGYAMISDERDWLNFKILRSRPDHERNGINAALVYGILCDQEEKLKKGLYICDGARNISHETAFQDYLVKYFEFRKAYCKLNVMYAPKIKVAVKLLYPLRKILSKLDSIGLMHKINAVLSMEELVRKEN